MSEPVEIIINPNKQMLRLYCGQCGDPKDIIIEKTEDNKVSVVVIDSEDRTTEENPEFFLKPVELIV